MIPCIAEKVHELILPLMTPMESGDAFLASILYHDVDLPHVEGWSTMAMVSIVLANFDNMIAGQMIDVETSRGETTGWIEIHGYVEN